MLQLSYNMQGKVNTIHLKVNNNYAQLPFNVTTRVMDWETITYEPTRRSIQTEWDKWVQGKNLSIELADRVDLAPKLTPLEPDWKAFKRAAYASTLLTGILKSTSDQFSVDNLRSIVDTLGDQTLGDIDYPILYAIWSAIIDGLIVKPTSTANLAELNTLATSTNMRFRFNTNAKMFTP